MRSGALLLLFACGPEVPVDPPDDSGLVALDAPQLLRRISLDLLGSLPSVEDLDTVESDPERVQELAHSWMTEPAFEERLVHLLAQRWRTRVDVFDITHQDLGLNIEQDYSFHRAVGEEPLRLMAAVVAEDRPWREILTTDETRVHELIAPHWPVDYPDGETGWQPARYTDGRPAVGVLATNGMWWRYTTTESNMNRGRAAEISRLLLCEDYLHRPISFGEEGFDDPEEAVRTSPYCLACHSSIDPVAASLFGFWWLAQYSTIEERSYHPEREPLAEELLGTSPAWYGQPMAGLAELGARVVNDPRFTSCAVESWTELLWQRDLRLEDQAELESLREAFLYADQRVQPLLLEIIDTPAYRAGAFVEDSAITVEEQARTRRLMQPDQLATSLGALTGFYWEKDGYHQLDSDLHGYRILAGGMDGISVTAPATRPGLTWSLVTQRAAQAAASMSVEATTSSPLLGEHSWVDDPREPAFAALLTHLHWQLFAQRSESAWEESMTEHWKQVEALEGADVAWISVLSLMLRDPLFLSY